MKRFAAVVLGASLLVLPSCGKKTDETARAAGITPVDALGLLSVNLAPSIEQKRSLLSVARRFPDAADKVKSEFDETRDDLLAEVLEDTGLDFESDVKPWLGNEVALVVLPPRQGTEVPDFLVLVETGDAAAAKTALDKAAGEEGFDAAYQVVDDFMVISDQDEDDAANQAALDRVVAQAAKDDGGLSKAEDFTSAVDELAGDRLILGWVAVERAAQLAIDLAGQAEFDYLEQLADSARVVAVDVHAEESAVEFQGVAIGSGEGGGGELVVTRGLPAASFGALTLFNAGKGIGDALRAFAGSEGPDVLAEFEEETGIDLEGDLLSWMGDELVVVVADGDPVPEFALVVEPSDDVKALNAVDKIRAALERQELPLEERQIAGKPAWVVPEPLTDNIQPAMALFPGRLVLASSPGYLERLAAADPAPLGDAAAYKKVFGDDEPDAVKMQFVLFIDPVREALEEAFLSGDPEGRAGYEQEAKPNLVPLSAFGMRAWRDGDVDRFVMRVTFD